MSQNEQCKKVKLYRTLKVVFYCLGLPLFLLIVIGTATKYIGHDPFMGEQTGNFLLRLKALFTGTALNGVGIAFAIWAVIAIVQIIVHFTVKSGRARLMIVTSVTMITMLGSMLIMDSVFNTKINEIAKSAPTGVTVSDYKTQLSYLNMISGNTDGRDLTRILMENVANIKRVYNVDYYAQDKTGTANNIGNNAVYYDTIIADDGTVGVDIGFNPDGSINFEGDDDYTNDHVLVRLAPKDAETEKNYVVGKTGYLEINGVKYSHYWCQPRTAGDENIFIWYTKDMMSELRDGEYGTAMYNQNNMISDGWVFGVENVLKILESYYESEAILNSLLAEGIQDGYGNTYNDFAATHQAVIAEAQTRMNDYYAGKIDINGEYADDWTSALYSQEVYLSENFSLTQAEIVALVSQLGAALGDNTLFDWLFGRNGEGLSGIVDITGLFDMLNRGTTIGGIIEALKGIELLAGALGNVDGDSINQTVVDVFNTLFPDKNIKNICISAVYKGEDMTGTTRNGLYVGIYKCTTDASGAIIPVSPDDLLLDINISQDMDLDSISALLNNIINNLNIGGTLNTVLGLVNTIGGVFGLDLDILLNLFDENGKVVDLTAFLADLLQSYYYYQSPVFSIYNFYVDYTLDEDDPLRIAQEKYAAYDRAYFIGANYGSMIASALLGDTLGAGAYPASFGLTDLAAVQQMITDLSYKVDYYPIFSLREMLLMFTAMVVMFMFFSYLCAIREAEWANGTVEIPEKKVRKKKNKKGGKDESVISDEVAIPANEENTALIVAENTDKEVG